jgi:hypothetical protein
VGDHMYQPSYENRYTSGWGTYEWLFGKIHILLIMEAFIWLIHPTYGPSLIRYY